MLFVLAAYLIGTWLVRWLFPRLLRRNLTRRSDACTRVPSFRLPLLALQTVANPIAWLVLHWVAIAVATWMDWPNGALTIVASLLTAWLLIRLATLLLRNKTPARFIAVAALNIFGWLYAVAGLLDSWSVTLGEVRVSPLTVVKVGLAQWFALWLANGIASPVERRLEHSRSAST